jgi:hypothetical protein
LVGDSAAVVLPHSSGVICRGVIKLFTFHSDVFAAWVRYIQNHLWPAELPESTEYDEAKNCSFGAYNRRPRRCTKTVESRHMYRTIKLSPKLQFL